MIALKDPDEDTFIYNYSSTQVSQKLLADNEAGLVEFQQKLRVPKMAMRRFPPKGFLMPIEFIIILPNDPEPKDDGVQDPSVSSSLSFDDQDVFKIFFDK